MNAAQADRDAVRRRGQLSAIHVAKAQLGLDDDTYRDLIARVSAQHGREVRSAKDLDARQRDAVLAELRAKGAAAPPRKDGRRPGHFPGKPANFNQLPHMITKIEAQLADMKLSWAYADAIAMRMHRIARVAWLKKESQLADIIAALDVEQKKRDMGAAVDMYLARLGETEEQMRARIALPDNWRRARIVLERLVKQLADECIARGLFDEVEG